MGKWLGYAAAWAAIIATVILLLQVIPPLFEEDGTPSASSSRRPHLERVDLVARNQVPEDQGLELLVRNSGGGRSVISRARLKIRRVYAFHLCFAQGNLSLSERYGVELSTRAKAGEIVEVPLHQQVGPDQADRFRINLEARPKEISGLVWTLYLFEIAVALNHDGQKAPLRMGTVQISLPTVPLSEYLLGDGGFGQAVETFSSPDDPLREVWAKPLACWQRNGRTAALARKSGATRSQELEEVLDAAAVPSWAELED
jgi:hypothetical protein